MERITAPLFLEKDSGLNDDLNGVERKVEFELKETKTSCEVVQSLAKWKRMALYRYGFKADEGLYTDMNAIRRDDDMDNIHSVFVDQWDWERVITKEERNLGFLKMIVQRIVDAVIDTHQSDQARVSRADADARQGDFLYHRAGAGRQVSPLVPEGKGIRRVAGTSHGVFDADRRAL